MTFIPAERDQAQLLREILQAIRILLVHMSLITDTVLDEDEE